MNKYCKILSTFCCILMLTTNCSNSLDIDELITKEWKKCNNKNNCTIDFSTALSIEWDEMYYFSAALSLEEINAALGTNLLNYRDVGNRIVFIKEGNIVYHKEWFYDPSEKPKGVVFSIDNKILKLDRSEAVFSIEKTEELYYLEPIHSKQSEIYLQSHSLSTTGQPPQ